MIAETHPRRDKAGREKDVDFVQQPGRGGLDPLGAVGFALHPHGGPRGVHLRQQGILFFLYFLFFPPFFGYSSPAPPAPILHPTGVTQEGGGGPPLSVLVLLPCLVRNQLRAFVGLTSAGSGDSRRIYGTQHEFMCMLRVRNRYWYTASCVVAHIYARCYTCVQVSNKQGRMNGNTYHSTSYRVCEVIHIYRRMVSVHWLCCCATSSEARSARSQAVDLGQSFSL